MNLPEYDIVAAAGVRRAVVPAGDIREDIAFQNDINLLLARLEGKNPLKALGWVREAVSAEPMVPFEPMLRVIRGGGGGTRPTHHDAQNDPFLGRVAVALGQ
jgi:hypothetical protein